MAGLVPPPPPGKPARPLKAGTVNRELATVIRVMTLAARLWRWIPIAPLIEKVDGPRKKAYPLNWSEQDRLLRKLPEHLRAAALFAVNTGVRESELCSLTWDMEVEIPELQTTAFILTRTKNDEERLVPLNAIARKIVDAQRGKHEDAVFTYSGKPITRLVNTGWRAAWKKAKLPVDPLILRGAHNLRHTFAHRLRAAGVSLEDRKALLGHTNGDITTHYSMPDIARLIECVERITKRRESVILRPLRRVTAETHAH
jgi:integrase